MNCSILGLPSTAAESCDAPSPEMPLYRTSQLVSEPLPAAAVVVADPNRALGAAVEHAVEHGVINGEERQLLRKFFEVQWDLVQVDAFDAGAFVNGLAALVAVPAASITLTVKSAHVASLLTSHAAARAVAATGRPARSS